LVIHSRQLLANAPPLPLRAVQHTLPVSRFARALHSWEMIMQIKDTRHETLDKYSIQDVSVQYEHLAYTHNSDGTRTPHGWLYVAVRLKPEPYLRNRFEGSSYEAKKHGAEALFIDCDELEVGALQRELRNCYIVLNQNDLLDELYDFKRKDASQASAST
jgi:hypothetical protein